MQSPLGRAAKEHTFRGDDRRGFVDRKGQVLAAIGEELQKVRECLSWHLLFEAVGHDGGGRGLEMFEIFSEDDVLFPFGVEHFDRGARF